MSRVLNVILTHQRSAEVERLLTWWSRYAPIENLLIAYGGTEEEFEKLPAVSRVFVADPQLRVNKSREKQSYIGAFRAAAEWLAGAENRAFTHVFFAEFDHLPLVDDLAAKLLERLDEQRADILGHRPRRIDGTSNVHYLHHVADPRFVEFWRRISVREDKETVLHMLSTGSFWSRDAFFSLAAQVQEVPVYLEIYLPTAAHHLGYRVKGFGDQSRCIFPAEVLGLSVETARQQGCWTVHPIKSCPPVDSSTTVRQQRAEAHSQS